MNHMYRQFKMPPVIIYHGCPFLLFLGMVLLLQLLLMMLMRNVLLFYLPPVVLCLLAKDDCK